MQAQETHTKNSNSLANQKFAIQQNLKVKKSNLRRRFKSPKKRQKHSRTLTRLIHPIRTWIISGFHRNDQ